MWFVQIIFHLQKVGVEAVFAKVEKFCFSFRALFDLDQHPLVDLQKGPKCYKKMHGLGIIQKVQQYLKLVRIFWRNCLEFFFHFK